MAVREILLLGNPLLYERCSEVTLEELPTIAAVVDDLHDTLMDFRERNGFGRAIAAPQIGVLKRLVYMHVGSPVVLINPVLHDQSPDLIELWDDCMSFPNLLVKVRRYRSCRITFRNLDWQEQTLALEDSLSELLQHELDHLDGILATMRAIDPTSFALASERARLL
jgi:peptide deformylase